MCILRGTVFIQLGLQGNSTFFGNAIQEIIFCPTFVFIRTSIDWSFAQQPKSYTRSTAEMIKDASLTQIRQQLFQKFRKIGVLGWMSYLCLLNWMQHQFDNIYVLINILSLNKYFYYRENKFKNLFEFQLENTLNLPTHCTNVYQWHTLT